MCDILKILVSSGRVYLAWTALRFLRFRFRFGTRTGTPPHLLLIAWAFPPEVSGGVDRPAALARYAAKAGWRVTVIAAPLDRPTAPLPETPGGVRVVRASRAPRTSYRLLPKLDGGFPDLLTAHDAAISVCEENPPSIIAVSGPPFMTFVSAFFLARRFAAPLVLDYRDEWNLRPPSFVHPSRFGKRWENRILESASAVLFATEGLRDLYGSHAGAAGRAKYHFVPNGWDPEDFRDANAMSRKTGARSKFTISFVGRSGPHTDPAPFLKSFSAVISRSADLRERVVVRFVGPKTPESEIALTRIRDDFRGSVELLGPVPKSTAVAEILDSDAVLLLLDPYFCTAVPGKLFEYIAAGKPVLVYGDCRVAADLGRELGAGLVVPSGDAAALETALRRLLREPCEHWRTAKRERWIAAHTREAQALRMLGILAAADRTHSPAQLLPAAV